MSMNHVQEYYDQMKEQYDDMIDNIKDFKDLLAENKIDVDSYNAAIKDIEIVKVNYERLAYIMWLFNRPDQEEEAQEVTITFDGPESATEAIVIEENKQALNNIKNIKEQNND